jgi:muramoyltetrapeptide carboxypeptidase
MGEYQYPSIGVIFSAMQLPPPLQPGDLLRVIAPSGCLRSHTPGGRSEIDAYHQGIEIWQQQGYRVEIASGCEAQWGYLDASNCDRLGAIQRFVEFSALEAVMVAVGCWKSGTGKGERQSG